MTTISFQTAARRSAPRLAVPIADLAAAVFSRVAGWFRRPLTRAEEAARLRELAAQYDSQPGFAADLRAAADRHLGDGQ